MAKKFKFRLESLHSLRKHKTTEAKNALGEVVQLRVAKQQRIAERTLYFEQLSMNYGTMRASEAQAVFAHKEAVRTEIQQLQKELVNLQEIEQQRRVDVTTTMRNEKVLDTLKEKQRTEHSHSVLREEQAFMDDLALRSSSAL